MAWVGGRVSRSDPRDYQGKPWVPPVEAVPCVRSCMRVSPSLWPSRAAATV